MSVEKKYTSCPVTAAVLLKNIHEYIHVVRENCVESGAGHEIPAPYWPILEVKEQERMVSAGFIRTDNVPPLKKVELLVHVVNEQSCIIP